MDIKLKNKLENCQGFTILEVIFIVVILGGLGQIPGTILAALVIGMLNTVFEFGTTAVVGKVLVFAMVILFLQWRPAGLMGQRAR